MSTANSFNATNDPIPFPDFTKLKIQRPFTNVLEVVLNDSKGNRWNDVLYNEFIECFRIIPSHRDVYCVLITSSAKHFTVGLDLNWAMSSGLVGTTKDKLDVARKSLRFQTQLAFMQKATDLVHQCPVPVICAVHGGVIGMGIDLITSCDIRYASSSAFFTVKEVDIGVVADIGTLARMPKQIGNQSLLRELVYTGKQFTATQAQQLGLVSCVFDGDEALRQGALQLCQEIASKSPVAIRGIKLMLNYEMSGKSPQDLQLMARVLNGSLAQTEDIGKAGMAFFQKKKPTFSKL
mmetsp:Transcript_39286/g.64270  ORF Transcript_39286/g.64270 Transcript_39286/m.64270 type:complete len:293 (-) Transcript_39286:120-998(-)